MLRKLFVALVILFLLVGNAQAVDRWYIYKNAALGTSSTLVTFGIEATSVTIDNFSAANILCVDWDGATAVCASDFEVRAGKSYTTPIGRGKMGRISVICNAATCDMQVFASN